MSMDPFLAEIYGTRETIGADGDDLDQEKLAEANFISQMCEAEGVDVDDISDEDAVKIAYEIWGEDSAIVKEAQEAEEAEEEEEEEEPPKEEKDEEDMEEKAAQADHLGRIMAHSFVQEQAFIEKEARGSKTVDFLANVGKRVLGKRGRGAIATRAEKGARKDLAKELTKKMRSGNKRLRQEARATMKAEKGGGPETLNRALFKERKMRAMVGGGALGAGAAGAAGAGYGGYRLATGGKKKKASALDELAEERAVEMLKEAGYEGAFTDEEKLAMAVEQRALEMLAEAGYPVE